MQLPVMPPVSPMLAKLSRQMPEGGGLLYEPKWDGFRCIVFRDGPELELGSRNERPLTRYFPELVESLLANLPARCVLDGEIVIVGQSGLDFDALLQRIHPAASRVKLLASETPASFVAFDLLALGDEDLRGEPFGTRRSALESALGDAEPPVYLTPATSDPAVARDWFERFEGAGLDGVVAKPIEPRLSRGRTRHVEGQARAHGGLRRGRLSLAQGRHRRRLAASRPVRRERIASTCRGGVRFYGRLAHEPRGLPRSLPVGRSRGPSLEGDDRRCRRQAQARRIEPVERREGSLLAGPGA